MRTLLPLSVLVLLGLSLAAAVPPAQAVDPCAKYGVCLPPVVNGCAYNALYVRGTLPTDGCAPSVSVYFCEFDYMGGGGPMPWDNLRPRCEHVATLP